MTELTNGHQPTIQRIDSSLTNDQTITSERNTSSVRHDRKQMQWNNSNTCGSVATNLIQITSNSIANLHTMNRNGNWVFFPPPFVSNRLSSCFLSAGLMHAQCDLRPVRRFPLVPYERNAKMKRFRKEITTTISTHSCPEPKLDNDNNFKFQKRKKNALLLFAKIKSNWVTTQFKLRKHWPCNYYYVLYIML